MRRDLTKPVLIHVCKDRTLTYRTRNQPVFNGKALPVFSVDTVEEAKRLITLVGTAQYEQHPLLPNQVWYKINVDFKQYLEYEDLETVAEKLQLAYALLLDHGDMEKSRGQVHS